MTWNVLPLFSPFVVVAVCAGCGPPEFHGIEGQVTLDGRPLSEARILFIPEQLERKKTGALINNGTYRLPQSVGLQPGSYRVQIIDNPPDIDPDQPISTHSNRRNLPERFATGTELRLELGSNAEGDFDFALESTAR